ncbi:DUF4843 domain-containing protein [Dysgonomonas sp. Marseille-P4677]|nr:DUF4843 domain-containing protein [Dysgonomonas sp. Marseille-P4677]
MLTPRDSITVSYGFLEKGQKPIDTAYIEVSIMGDLADYDRQIKYKIGEKTTAIEGTDFKILDAYIPANNTAGAIAVELYREKYTDLTKRIFFDLLPNEHFQTNFKEVLVRKTDTLKTSTINFQLTVSDFLTIPPQWGNYQSFLGPFSAKKLFLLKEIANVDIEIFYMTGANAPSIPYVTALGSILKKYLAEQKRADNTIYEDNGKEMVAGKDA